MGGKVQDPNAALLQDAGLITHSPYRDGWVCRIEPSDLTAELAALRIGKPVVAWYSEEIGRLQALRGAQKDPAQPLPWAALEQGFLLQDPARVG